MKYDTLLKKIRAPNLITDPFIYLLTLSLMVAFFYILEQKVHLRLFAYLPVVLLIYAGGMMLANLGLFSQSQEIKTIYSQAKSNLLPAMLFLMLLGVDFSRVARLGRSLLSAYLLAVFSLVVAFVLAAFLFGFDAKTAAAFGALCGSWMGGTANMIAVGAALGVSEEMFAVMLVVDSVNYTLWLMTLLFLVPFAPRFNRFTASQTQHDLEIQRLGIGCACEMGAPRYFTLLALALFVSLLSQSLSELFTFLDPTTRSVLFATLFGFGASFTPLRHLSGASRIATSMLYLLIALIASTAKIEDFGAIYDFVLIGFAILLTHATLLVLGAKLLKLDLFSIAVASLANIGGAASAPLLAAAYHRELVGVGVVMAIMGYLVGTVGGLVVGNILIGVAR